MYHLYNQKPERSTLDVVVAQYSRLVPTAVLRYIIREWNTEGGIKKIRMAEGLGHSPIRKIYFEILR